MSDSPIRSTCVVVALAVGGGASAGSAHAEFINIDFSAAASAPSPAYGGAASQPGQWNVLVGGTTAPQPLFDTAGAATAAALTVDVLRAEYASDAALTLGDDQALYDDCLDLGPLNDKTRIFIDGLAPGFYGVYIYAWSGDSELFRTGVTVIGAASEQSIGGSWPGGHQLGGTFAYTTFFTAGGGGVDATILLRTLAGFGTVNGLQLVQIPGPSPLLALLLTIGAAASGRRRR